MVVGVLIDGVGGLFVACWRAVRYWSIVVHTCRIHVLVVVVVVVVVVAGVSGGGLGSAFHDHDHGMPLLLLSLVATQNVAQHIDTPPLLASKGVRGSHRPSRVR